MRILWMAGVAFCLTGCAASYSSVPAKLTSQIIVYKQGKPTSISNRDSSNVQISPNAVLGTGKLYYIVTIQNNFAEPVDFDTSNVSATTGSGAAVRIYTARELQAQARSSARWAQAAVALSGAAQTVANSQPTTVQSTGSISGGGSTVRYQSTTKIYDPNASAAANARVNQQTQDTMGMISDDLSYRLENIDSTVIQRNTIDPQTSYSGELVVDVPEFGRGDDRTIKFKIGVGSDVHEFLFNVEKY